MPLERDNQGENEGRIRLTEPIFHTRRLKDRRSRTVVPRVVKVGRRLRTSEGSGQELVGASCKPAGASLNKGGDEVGKEA